MLRFKGLSNSTIAKSCYTSKRQQKELPTGCCRVVAVGKKVLFVCQRTLKKSTCHPTVAMVSGGPRFP